MIDRVLEFSADQPVPLSSLEGFIRQVIGWREFMRGVYIKAGVQQRTSNFWQHSQSLPTSFYNATTGIEPVDAVIGKLINNAYSHHIERLMVMGNFMLLCQINPNHVYRWFMEWYIDAYDWVMVPNVYGMSQFADGGLMSTKPYLSGSNYLLKMGDYKRGKWCEVWDALYWRFIYTNMEFFSSNSRTRMVANLALKMDKDRLDHHLKVAEEYLEQLA